MVLSRWYFRKMEVRWLSIVDLWQTYILPTPPRSSSLLIAILLAGSGKSILWYGVDPDLHALQRAYFIF